MKRAISRERLEAEMRLQGERRKAPPRTSKTRRGLVMIAAYVQGDEEMVVGERATKAELRKGIEDVQAALEWIWGREVLRQILAEERAARLREHKK